MSPTNQTAGLADHPIAEDHAGRFIPVKSKGRLGIPAVRYNGDLALGSVLHLGAQINRRRSVLHLVALLHLWGAASGLAHGDPRGDGGGGPAELE